ncbi:MAG TPA: HutD family protein [Steroidobacteraceae bacterium]|nr:HutD family protein [Steroidobacteraceae bacterium]
MVTILRTRDRSTVPWKNGGGLTREVAAHPPGSDLGSFLWRMSIAEVRCAAPFSSFSGVDRHMAVLEGRLRLAIQGQDNVELTPESPPVSFAGDVVAFAEPLGAAVTDLNVMTRRGRFTAQLTRHRLSGRTTLHLDSGTTVIVALSALTVRTAASDVQLAPLDAALIGDVTRLDLAAAAVGAGEGSASLYLAHLVECRASH